MVENSLDLFTNLTKITENRRAIRSHLLQQNDFFAASFIQFFNSVKNKKMSKTLKKVLSNHKPGNKNCNLKILIQFIFIWNWQKNEQIGIDSVLSLTNNFLFDISKTELQIFLGDTECKFLDQLLLQNLLSQFDSYNDTTSSRLVFVLYKIGTLNRCTQATRELVALKITSRFNKLMSHFQTGNVSFTNIYILFYFILFYFNFF